MGCYEQPAITAITPVMAAPITLSGAKTTTTDCMYVCGRPQAQGYIIQPTCSMVVQMPPMTSTGVPQASSRCLGGIDMLSDLRFGLRLSAHSVSEWTSDASSVADRDDRQQPLMESVCDNGLVKASTWQASSSM